MVLTGATFADASAEWQRYIEHDRGRKPSPVVGYKAIVRAQLLPAYGELPLEAVTTSAIEAWLGSFERSASTRLKAVVLLHGIFQRAKKVWALAANPVADVEKFTAPRTCAPSKSADSCVSSSCAPSSTSSTSR